MRLYTHVPPVRGMPYAEFGRDISTTIDTALHRTAADVTTHLLCKTDCQCTAPTWARHGGSKWASVGGPAAYSQHHCHSQASDAVGVVQNHDPEMQSVRRSAHGMGRSGCVLCLHC